LQLLFPLALLSELQPMQLKSVLRLLLLHGRCLMGN
jgi:hypothetical protein